MLDVARTVDRFGFGWAHTVRSAVGYVTGCRRRSPVVGGAIAVTIAGCALAGMASPIANPTPLKFATWFVVTMVVAWIWMGEWGRTLRPVAASLDAGPADTLPVRYPTALRMARWGSLAVTALLISLSDPLWVQAGWTLVVWAALTAYWVTVHLGGAGTRTLAGDVLGLFAHRRLTPATETGS